MEDMDYMDESACTEKDFLLDIPSDNDTAQQQVAFLAQGSSVLCDTKGQSCYFVPQGNLYCKRSNSNNPLDYVVVVIIVLFCIPFIAANLVMLYHRKYKPIRAKGVDVTVTSSIGGLIWIASTLVVNNHFRRHRDTVWSWCTVWTFWLQILFGFALWLCCLIVRLYRLFCVFKLTRRPIKHIWIPLIVLLSPTLVFCISASAQHASRYRNNDCKFKNARWAVGALIIVPSYFLLMTGLAYSLRNIRDEFNEYRSIRTGGIMAFFLFFLGMVTLTTKTYLEVTGRAFFSLAVSAEVFYYFWARNGLVVWMVLRHKDAYLRLFEESLRNRGGLGRKKGRLEDLDASTVQFVEPDREHSGDYKVAEGENDHPEGDGAPMDVYTEKRGMAYDELVNVNAAYKEKVVEMEDRQASLRARVADLESEVARLTGRPYEQRVDVEVTK